MRSIQAFWYALRNRYTDGAVILPREAVIVGFELLGVCRSDVYYLLKLGNGIYWEYTPGPRPNVPGSVRIFTLMEVCSALGLKHPGHSISRPIADLGDPEYMAKTWQLCGEHAQGLHKFMTQALYEQYTGFSPWMQSFYRRALGITMDKHLKAFCVSNNMDKIVECMRGHIGDGQYYRGIVFVYGMAKPVKAVLKVCGSSFPTKPITPSPESSLVYVGKCEGKHIWIDRTDCASIEEMSKISRSFSEIYACTCRDEPPLPQAASEPKRLGLSSCPSASHLEVLNPTQQPHS